MLGLYFVAIKVIHCGDLAWSVCTSYSMAVSNSMVPIIRRAGLSNASKITAWLFKFTPIGFIRLIQLR